jgi:signal transduction histidine kinase
MRRTALGILAVLVVALVVAEATMQPTSGERAQLLVVFGLSAIVAATLGAVMRTSTRRSLRSSVLGTALAAVVVAGATVALSAGSMFLSGHDLRLVLVALALGVGLAIVLATGLSDSLVNDLRSVARTARRVGQGRRDEATGVDRPDEVGQLAAAVDAMVARLAEADEERTRVAAARRELLVSVGHDLRAPLTSLRAAVEALRDGVVDDPPAYLRTMAHEVELLGSLVDDLFLLARIEAGGLDLQRERLDLAELGHEAVEAVTPLARDDGISVHLDVDAAVFVEGSGRELRRVLRNLLTNAIRHSPAGGTVWVEVGDGPTASVVVRDEGPGFDADLVERAFEPFTRGDPARGREGGAGLGLAIVAGLVDAHGGSVAASPGPGGRVRVDLPIS